MAQRSETALIEEIIIGVRAIATGDAEVLQLLEAFARGVVEQATIMRETGMSAQSYRAARIRMRRALAALPADLQRAVFEVGDRLTDEESNGGGEAERDGVQRA